MSVPQNFIRNASKICPLTFLANDKIYEIKKINIMSDIDRCNPDTTYNVKKSYQFYFS